MNNLNSPVDDFAEKAVLRRRAAEAARRDRIFNPRRRKIGLDVDALDQQVDQKKLQQDAEKHRDRAYDDLRQRQDEILLQRDTEEKEKRASLQAGLAQFWATHQRVEDSSDADLKCDQKGALHLTLPEDQLGPASMQTFQGEDPGEERRRRERTRQTERDLRAQMDDDERRRTREKHRETLAMRMLVNEDLRWTEQAELEDECRKAARMALDNYNRARAADQAAELKERRRREEQENLAEMWQILTSDMMAGQDAGQDAEQLRGIMRERDEQRLERERQREAEKLEEAMWDFQQLKVSREAEEEASREEELRRERRIQTDQYNTHLAREQQAHQEYLDKKLYTNKPSKDYFHQFNSSTR